MKYTVRVTVVSEDIEKVRAAIENIDQVITVDVYEKTQGIHIQPLVPMLGIIVGVVLIASGIGALGVLGAIILLLCVLSPFFGLPSERKVLNKEKPGTSPED